MNPTRSDLTRVFVAVLATVACSGLSACDDDKKPSHGSKPDGGKGPDASDKDGGSDDRDGAVPSGDSGVDDPLTTAYRDGTRLRAQWWKAEGSDPLFAGWYDTKLKTNCSFEPAEDGSYRCLPVERGAQVISRDPADCDAGGALDVYALTAPAPGQLVAVYGTGPRECGRAVRFSAIYRLGKRIDASTLPACIQGHGLHVFEEGERLEMTDFVGATLEVAEVGDRLGVHMYVASDGARGPRALYDTQAKQECASMLPDADGIHRCVPAEVARPAHGYRDAECTQDDLVEVSSRECSAPKLSVADKLSESCTTSNEWFQVGAKFSTPRYELVSDECVAAADEWPRFVRGPEVEPDTLPGAILKPSGKGRLKPLVFTTVTGVVLMPQLFLFGYLDPYGGASYRDEILGTRCRPLKTPDGTFRCIPSIIYEGAAPEEIAAQSADPLQRFSDDKCTKPLHVSAQVGSLQFCAPTFAFYQAVGSAEPMVSSVYALSAPQQFDAPYFVSDGDCVQANAGVFQTAEELPFSQLAEVTRQP